MEQFTIDEKLKLKSIAKYANNYKLPPATKSTMGGMSSEDKAKLDEFGSAATYATKEDLKMQLRFKTERITANSKGTLVITGIKPANDQYMIAAYVDGNFAYPFRSGNNWACAGLTKDTAYTVEYIYSEFVAE